MSLVKEFLNESVGLVNLSYTPDEAEVTLKAKKNDNGRQADLVIETPEGEELETTGSSMVLSYLDSVGSSKDGHEAANRVKAGLDSITSRSF